MTSETGDLLEKPKKKGTFKKGYDPRRNLKGVPKEAIKMRHMLRKIAAELVAIKDEKGNEVEVTRLYARARLAFSSRNYKEFEMLLKALYPGLLKDEFDVTSGREKLNIALQWRTLEKDDEHNPPPTSSSPG